MKIIKFTILFFLLSLPVLAQSNQEKVQQSAEMIVAAYNGKDYVRIEKEFNPEMKVAISSEKLKNFLDQTHAELGKITKIGTPNFLAPVAAVFPAEFERGKREMVVAIDEKGKIAGLQIMLPQVPKPANVLRAQTKLALPFKGEWFVFWGGDASNQNYHQDVPEQRFAFDIVKVGADGKTYQGDGKRNEYYYAFGQEITAPAEGIVDGIHDNVPGEMNRVLASGNLVIIKHSEGENSVFAHFKQNSIRVKVGDKIVKGQLLGLCGNSGNSSEAHLHYQIQSAPFFKDESSMKIFFEKINVKRDGKGEVKNYYSPVKGDIVSN